MSVSGRPDVFPAHARTVILVVEQDEDVRACARELLECEGYVALTARDGAEALSLIERTAQPPSLVVFDLEGRPDELALVRRLREVSPTRNVPVLGLAESETESLAARLGIPVLEKLRAEVLLEGVRACAGARRELHDGLAGAPL